LGYRLAQTEKLLMRFIDVLHKDCTTTVIRPSALDGAQLPAGGDPSW
jgi:hypothetical protein